MYQWLTISVALTVLALGTEQAHAQIYECSPGVWQNIPCKGTPARTMAETPPDPRLSDPVYQQKRATIQSAFYFQEDMRDRGVEFDAIWFERKCMAPEMSPKHCQLLLALLRQEYEAQADKQATQRAFASLLQGLQDSADAAETAAAEAAAAREAAERATAEIRNLPVPYGY